MFESGAVVAAALEAAGASLEPAQTQPNGVDLTVGAVFTQTSRGRIGREIGRASCRERV